MSLFISSRKLPISGLSGVFPSVKSFRYNRRIRFKLLYKMYLAITYQPSKLQLPRSLGAAERLLEAMGGFVYSEHKTGSWGLRGLGFQT